MEKTKTISRLNRLKRLEQLARERVLRNRLWLHERQQELDSAAREHGALQSYRNSYRNDRTPDASGDELRSIADVPLTMLAHRQRFVARLCTEIDQLSDREYARAEAVEQQREQLQEALSESIALSQLCDKQASALASAAARDEQRRLDEVGQIQHGAAAHVVNNKESQYV